MTRMSTSKKPSGRIDEAITFTPTREEFNDPLEYIAKIRPVAENYGICKIIPPSDWRPPFCIDKQKCRFKPRIQRLNELEANNRVKLMFLDDLSKFWDAQGYKLRIPTVEGKALDYFKIYKLVEKMGGYEKVCHSKEWSQLARILDYKDKASGRILRQHYESRLYPYVLFKAGVTAPATPPNASTGNETSDDETCSAAENNKGTMKRTRRMNTMPVPSTSATATSNSNKSKKNGNRSKKTTTTNDDADDDFSIPVDEIKCLNCGRGDDEQFILLCDGCDDSYHTFCLFPPLKEVPKGDWRCPTCVAEICKKPTEAYGFSHCMDEYSLEEFGKMADQFKLQYFRRPLKTISCQEVEDEFWKILSSPDKPVEVKYGADLHTLDIGSGFPTKCEKGKLKTNNQPYVNSPWNLNNLSHLDKSVLSHMNVEISGMKVPWAYVGMCFSCFCWHVEDHWSYSINYLHWGEPKTWYGVSGADAEKFEKVMKSQASELFDRSPDLLHHLVTIMNPYTLRDAGVPIYRIDQREGEFVVTFPRAYHAGFNQGFNFAEAVNFAPADWIPMGRMAVESYKLVKRHTVFAHDELVCKIALVDSFETVDVRMAHIVAQELKCIIDNEKKNRTKLKERDVKTAEVRHFELIPDDLKTCCHCKTTLFISAVKCKCKPDKLICLDHYEELCKPCTETEGCAGGNSNARLSTNPAKRHELTFLYRYTLEELNRLYNKMTHRSLEYTKWCRNVESILNRNGHSLKIDLGSEGDDEDDEDDEANLSDCQVISASKPNIRVLKKLVHDARSRKYPRAKAMAGSDADILTLLERELAKAEECSLKCQKFLSMAGNFVEKKETLADESGGMKKKRSMITSRPRLDDLKRLAADMEKCVCQIGNQTEFKRLLDEALSKEKRIVEIVQAWNTDTSLLGELRDILGYLERSGVEFSYCLVEDLKSVYKQADWSRRLDDCDRLTIEEITKFINEFETEGWRGDINCSAEVNDKFKQILDLLSMATQYNKKITALIDSYATRKPQFDELEKLLSEAKLIPVYMTSVDRLEKIVREARLWKDNVSKLLTVNVDMMKNLPYVSDLAEWSDRGKKLPLTLHLMPEIENKIRLANDWIARCTACFLSADYNHHFNQQQQQQQPQLSEESNLMNIQLVQLLTPRVSDLYTQIRKLHNFLKTHGPQVAALAQQTQESLSPENTNKTTGTSVRRPRTKHLLNASLSSSLPSAYLTYHPATTDPLLELTGCSDLAKFYTQYRLYPELAGKYNVLVLRELEMIKHLRRLNADRISLFRAYLQNLVEQQQQQQLQHQQQQQQQSQSQQQTSETSSALNVENIAVKEAPVEQDFNQTTQTITTITTTPKTSNNTLSVNTTPFPYKCCACNKSILSAISVSQFSQCQLCSGLLHITCHGKSIQSICSRCERSRRPEYHLVIDLIDKPEMRGVRSFESNAFQLMVERISHWEMRHRELCADKLAAQILDEMRILRTNSNSSRNADISSILASRFESLSITKKAELTELLLDGYLIEVDIPGHEDIRTLFQLINKDSSKELENLTQLLNKTNLIEISEQANHQLSKQNQQQNHGGQKRSIGKNAEKSVKKSKKIKSMLIDQQQARDASMNETISSNHHQRKEQQRMNKSAHEPLATTSGEKRLKIKNKKFLSTSVNSTTNSKKANNKTSTNVASASASSSKSTGKKRSRDDEIDHDDGSACAALKCLHPTGKLVSWVACDKCNKWFHQSCVGFESKNLDKEEKYFCVVCGRGNCSGGGNRDVQ